MSSVKPGWLCGSSLDNAWGDFVWVIEDGRAVFDVIPVPIVCSTGVLGLRGVGFGFGVEVLGVALGIGGRGCWCFEFSEESAVSQGDSARSVNSDTVLVVGECSWPVVSHWWVVGRCIVTICPFWRGHKVCAVLLYCSIRRAFRQDRIISRFFAAAIQSARGL